MRNLKTKGFTLVELIVVIAIIGVLAAVLVPAMLGYMRDSKISQANQNAHAVYTAAQAAVTKHCTANGTAATKGEKTFSGNAEAHVTDFQSFGDYLGDQFKGYYAFQTSTSGDTINWAIWALDFAPTAPPADEAAQIAAYDTGDLVGVHPQYPGAAGTAGGNS